MITRLDEHCALVLIDLQTGILQGPTVHPQDAVLRQAVCLSTAFQAVDKPVVFVTVVPDGPWTHTRKEVPARPAVLPDDFAQLHAKLQPRSSDICIRKHQWTAFYQTDLHAQLQSRGITQLVLAGIATSVGVEGTARDAAVLGYNLAFATDAMTDRHADSHTHSVSRIFPRLGEVGETREILAALCSGEAKNRL